MQYAVDSGKMKKIDDYTINILGIPAMELMERAAESVVKQLRQKITKLDRILAVCGCGNNGGDGAAIGRLLCAEGYSAAILLTGAEEKFTPQLKEQLKLARMQGVQIEHRDRLSEYNIIVDAIFGVGLSRPVTGEYEELFARINRQKHRVFAVDIPSGISADDGRIMNAAIYAEETITFGQNKIGLLLYPGAQYAGRITVADIGFPASAIEQAAPDTFYYQPGDLRRLPARQAYSHKGSYGKVLIIAGSRGMAGAAVLSARAAYRSGTGLVKILSAECNRNIIQTAVPEATFSAYDEEGTPKEKEDRLCGELSRASAVVIGPGIGLSKVSEELVDLVLKKAQIPVILDADAITVLSKRLDESGADQIEAETDNRFHRLERMLPNQVILTPHLMELSRLLNIPIADIKNKLIDTVRRVSYNSKLIYVAKDARTVAVNRKNCYINVSGNSGMATGGSGDVLTGIIAAFIAQGMEPYSAACMAVYVHGLAGDAAAKSLGAYSMMAGDLAESIEKVLINLDIRSDLNEW